MEEHTSVPEAGGWGGGAETERESIRMQERDSAREGLAPPFMCFLPPGSTLYKLCSARSAILPEVLTSGPRTFL